MAPADVYIAIILPDGRVGIHYEETGGKVGVADITEALAAAQGVDSSNTWLFPLPSCLLSGDAAPTADAVAAAIATGEPLPHSMPVAKLSHGHYYAAGLGGPPPLATGTLPHCYCVAATAPFATRPPIPPSSCSRLCEEAAGRPNAATVLRHPELGRDCHL